MQKTVLIVDDEPTVVSLASQKLREHGYDVRTARNGREAWEVVQNSRVDLVVTDVVMPIMDGVDLYKELKKDFKSANIPIVIITDSRIFRESFQALGVEHFLPKPLDAVKLIHKVDYIFTCADLVRKNKQALVLGAKEEVNAEITGIFEAQGCVVGASTDPIDFFSNCLILTPRVVVIDALIKGDVPSRDTIRALRCFTRLASTNILVFTHFLSEDIGSMQGIEELEQAKNECMEAGATKYIGRFTPTTFWDTIKDMMS
ncbi:MAG: response regulator [Candidatus Omnitrophota bacterium]